MTDSMGQRFGHGRVWVSMRFKRRRDDAVDQVNVACTLAATEGHEHVRVFPTITPSGYSRFHHTPERVLAHRHLTTPTLALATSRLASPERPMQPLPGATAGRESRLLLVTQCVVGEVVQPCKEDRWSHECAAERHARQPRPFDDDGGGESDHGS